MGNMSNIQDNIDALIYAIGDAPRKYTEDGAKYVDGYE